MASGSPRVVLAGDVGGTNARLALYEVGDGRLERVWRRTWASREHASLEAVVEAAAREWPVAPRAAAVGVAGPVVDGVCRATNLPWVVDERALARAAGVPDARLVNDAEASALGVDDVDPAQVRALLGGEPDPRGPRALLTLGTGLGQAGVVGGRAFPCEGGHADFAPADELQVALWRTLRERHGHVSWERVLSGPGLADLARFLRARRGEPPSAADDDPAAVTAAARDGSDAVAVEAVETFAAVCGAEAGNAALRLLATGGVWIAGGIAPAVLPFLAGPRFRDAFLGKGRLRAVLERVPVRVVLDPDVALLGAARRAAGPPR